jgi:Holin of 3TMs, for gene-transfer release
MCGPRERRYTLPILDKIASVMGGNIADGVASIIRLFKVDPNLALQHQSELAKIQADLQGKMMDAVTAEINQGGEIIKAEAQSQSWLPRNVRPLLLLLWGLTITFNALVPLLARFWVPLLTPIPLDPWVYKLTAIGFTGYVTARTWEKVTDNDK